MINRDLHTLAQDDAPAPTVDITVVVARRQHPWPKHGTLFTDIYMITNGALVGRLNGRLYRITRGALAILAPGDTLATPWAGSASGIFLRYRPDMCPINTLPLDDLPCYHELFAPQHAGHRRHTLTILTLDDTTRVEAERLLTTMAKEGSKRQPGYAMAMAGLLLQFIVVLCRHYTHTTLLPSYQFARLVNVIRYMESNYAEPITLDQLAASAAMKRRNFIKVFRDATGLTPTAYLSHHRVLAAALALRHTTRSVTDIALTCGFSDSNYFARQFKSILHTSPTAYRREKR